MNVIEAFVANRQTAIPVQPSERSLHDPARPTVAAAMRAIAPRDHRRDATGLQLRAVPDRVVAAVPLDHTQFANGGSPSASERRHTVDQGQQFSDIGTVGGTQPRNERDAVGFGEEMVFGTRLAAIGWVRSSFFPRCSARTDELSTTPRTRSSWPRRRSSASNVSWTRCQTPARCQAAKRRQHTVPEPQPICGGSRFHGIPVRNTYRIPVSTARSGRGVRPAYRRWRDGRAGNNGSIKPHSRSSISNLLMRDRLLRSHATVPRRDLTYKC